MSDAEQKPTGWAGLSDTQKDFIVGGAILVVLVLFALIGFALAREGNQSQKNKELAACLSQNQTMLINRTDALAGLNNTRSDALDQLLRDVGKDTAHPATTKKAQAAQEKTFQDDLRAYIRASNRYKHGLKAHPVPPSPKVQCG